MLAAYNLHNAISTFLNISVYKGRITIVELTEKNGVIIDQDGEKVIVVRSKSYSEPHRWSRKNHDRKAARQLWNGCEAQLSQGCLVNFHSLVFDMTDLWHIWIIMKSPYIFQPLVFRLSICVPIHLQENLCPMPSSHKMNLQSLRVNSEAQEKRGR